MWYEEQLEKYQGHKEAILQLDEIYAKRKKELEEKADKAKKKQANDTYKNLEQIAMLFGEKAVRIAKAVAVPKALMNIYTGASEAYHTVPFPANLVAAAAVIAEGMGTIMPVIRGQNFGAAHGGLDYVPKEQTYLLDRGERVLSPNQNRELMEFMAEGGGGLTIGQMNIDILKNATNAESLLKMNRNNWEDLVEFGIIPAMRRLAKKGIKP